MKIIIAPDSFKGSISSTQAAKAMQKAIREIDPAIDTFLFPMADGGEGTVEAIVWAKSGEKIVCSVLDPVGRPIEAVYGWIEEEKIAVIETAAASGLPLLKDIGLNPATASSYGTGQLIADAIEHGAKTIILGLGGSATVDAGVGLFQALGVKFYDDRQEELDWIGGQLHRISAFDATALQPGLSGVRIIVASDVTNPLLGDEGAVAVFGPQKGVPEQELQSFEDGMRRFSELAVQWAGKDMRGEPGSGAAGGIGFLLQTFLEVEFQNGLHLIVHLVGLDKQLEGADLVLTGEGRIDGQSLYGKVPVGIGRLAKKNNVPVIAFAGSIGPGIESLEQEGIVAVMPITDAPMSLEEALIHGKVHLYEATKRMMKILEIGCKLNGMGGSRGAKKP